MIDHIGLNVADYERSKAFYLAALAPLGYELCMEIPEAGPHAGFGAGGKPDFWITQGSTTTPPVHLAFGAKDRAMVRAFYGSARGRRARQWPARPAPGLSPELLRRLRARPGRPQPRGGLPPPGIGREASAGRFRAKDLIAPAANPRPRAGADDRSRSAT